MQKCSTMQKVANRAETAGKYKEIEYESNDSRILNLRLTSSGRRLFLPIPHLTSCFYGKFQPKSPNNDYSTFIFLPKNNIGESKKVV